MGTESHDGVVLQAITVPRAPSPEGRCYLHSARDSDPCRQALPRLYRSYWLMRRTEILPQPRVPPCALSLRRLLRTPAGRRSFPALSPQIFPQLPGPLPRRSPWCNYSFLPTGHRPTPSPKWVGTPQSPAQRLLYGGCYRGCSHSLIFRPPGLLATQVVPTAGHVITTPPRAAVTFTSTHISVRYLPEQWIC